MRLLVEEDGHGHHLGEEEELRSYSGCSDAKKGLKLGLVLDSSWDSMWVVEILSMMALALAALEKVVRLREDYASQI